MTRTNLNQVRGHIDEPIVITTSVKSYVRSNRLPPAFSDPLKSIAQSYLKKTQTELLF